VSNARSGYALKFSQSLDFGLNKRTIASAFVLMAGLHIMLANLTSTSSDNAIWPTLAIGYGLLIATLMILDRRVMASSQSFIDSTQSSLWSSPPHASSAQDIPARQPHNLTALRQAHRQRAVGSSPITSRKVDHSSYANWTDLMSQVSHELRTPLNAMIGFSDVMNEELLGPLENPTYREYLGHIRDSGHELLKSAEDTLAMTSLLANRSAFEGNNQTSNLKSTLVEAWSFVATQADQKSITLKLDIVSSLNIKADHRPLKQTFVNLLSEAVKHTANNGTILVRAHQNSEIVEIEVSTQCTTQARSELATSLSVSIAQALLELQGTTLITGVNDTGTWSAVTLFDCPLQSDFFSEHVSTPNMSQPCRLN